MVEAAASDLLRRRRCWQHAFESYAGHTPLLTIMAPRPALLVTLTLPEQLEAGHVQFAQQLACQAWAYAVAVERRYRGLPALPVPHVLAAAADTWTSDHARPDADRQEVTA